MSEQEQAQGIGLKTILIYLGTVVQMWFWATIDFVCFTAQYIWTFVKPKTWGFWLIGIGLWHSSSTIVRYLKPLTMKVMG